MLIRISQYVITFPQLAESLISAVHISCDDVSFGGSRSLQISGCENLSLCYLLQLLYISLSPQPFLVSPRSD